MNRLPTEVFQYLLTTIFEEIRNGSEPRSVYTRMFQLRRVSTTWMAAIDSHPPLWTLLTNHNGGRRLFSRVIERSGTLPLHVDLFWFTNDNLVRDMIDAVVKVAPRWLSLHVEAHHYEEPLKSLLATPAPQLREVRLGGATAIAPSVHWFDGAAPKVQSAIMIVALPNWKSLLAWDLKRLEISCLTEPQETEFEGLLQVISASPSLEELELYRWEHEVTPIRMIPSARGVTSLDRLRKVRLVMFPWQWAVPLLETIRIPHSCVSNIVVDASGEAAPDAVLRLLKRELTEAETVAISLVAQPYDTAMELTCTSIATASIRFRMSEWKHPYAISRDGISRALSVIHELKTPNQYLGVPVNLSITRDFPEQMSGPADQEFSSMMVTADPLFPSVTKLQLDIHSQPLFLKHSNWPRFINLSEIEIKGCNDWATLNDVAKWVLERAALANSAPNVTALKTVTVEAKYLQPAVIESISNTLRDVVDLHWI